MNIVSKRVLFLMVSAFALVFAACGGGSDDNGGGSGGGDPLTEAELIEQADALCKTYDEGTDDIEAPDIPSSADLSDLDDDQVESVVTYFDEGIDLFETMYDGLADLTPPSDLEDDWKALLEELRDMRGLFDDARDAVADQDDDEFERLNEELGEVRGRADDKAQDLGLEVCGN